MGAMARKYLEELIVETVSRSQSIYGWNAAIEAKAIVDAMLQTDKRWMVRDLVREADEKEPSLPLDG